MSKLHRFFECALCHTKLHATTITAAERTTFPSVSIKGMPPTVAFICRSCGIYYGQR